ncbi:MAG: motility protein A [Bacteriovoracaceae bacterium]
MNVYSIFGFILASIVLVIGLKLSTDDLTMFWDIPSVFIVFGGTFAAAAICFQLNRLFMLFKIFFRRMIFGKKNVFTAVINEVMLVADCYRKGEAIKSIREKISDPFLKEALQIMEDGVIGKDEIIPIMQKRNDNITFHYMEEANKIKTIGKFPPAFGMIGTTIGMIVLLGNLGGEDAMKKMGPAMGVCLITTLYGSVVANFLFIPVSENLIEETKSIYMKNKMIIEGVALVMDKANPILMVEKLNSYANPTDRVDWRTIVNKKIA